ncbi:MAG: hypothetical protein Salg2KO_04330 [Salibacteraceae bacterium]
MTSPTLEFIERVHFEQLTDLDLYNGIDELTGFKEVKIQLLLNEVESFIRRYRELRITRIGHDQMSAELKRISDEKRTAPMLKLKSRIYRHHKQLKDSKRANHSLKGIDEYNQVFDYEKMFFPFDLTNIYCLQGMLLNAPIGSDYENAITTFDGYDDGFRHNEDRDYKPVPDESFDWRQSRVLTENDEVNLKQSEDVNEELFPGKWNFAKRVLLLNELGIIDFLRKESKLGHSDHALANVIAKLLHGNQGSISSVLSGIVSDSDKSPYRTKKNVTMIKEYLIENHFNVK